MGLFSETEGIQSDAEQHVAEVMESQLGDTGLAMLRDQLEVLTRLNEREGLNSSLRESFRQGRTVLPKGTLLHGMGMYPFSMEAVEGVAEKGVVSGELIGIPEDMETHGCADFFKVPQDMTLAEYLSFCRETVRPEGSGIKRSRGERLLLRGLTFIVDPAAEGMAELLEHDGYANPDMRPFFRPPSSRTSEDTAAILGGIPRGAIAGLLADEGLLQKDGVLERLKALFPNLPIFNHEGERR